MFHSNMLKFNQQRFPALSRLLYEHFRQRCKDAATARYMKMIFPDSAFILGNATPHWKVELMVTLQLLKNKIWHYYRDS